MLFRFGAAPLFDFLLAPSNKGIVARGARGRIRENPEVFENG